MSKIYGDEKTINAAKTAPAGDKSVYINWDAINELPDEYEAIITEVKYDPSKLKESFSDVGNGNWMPKPELMYEIAKACGISGHGKGISAPITEEVDINPMLMKPIEAEPTMRKIIVGKSVTKISTIMQEDGTLLQSSPCNCEYNAWERCCEAWAKEEEDTEGYKDIKTGEYTYFNNKKYGDYYMKGNFSYPVKYNNKFKRKNHFQGELKFAHAKAETKAHEKTIRELASLVTGYKGDDLKSGKLIFAKIRRSREILKAETAARLSALSRGALPAPDEPINLLFGPSGDTQQQEPPQEEQQQNEMKNAEPVQEESDPFADNEPEKSNRERFIDALEFYFKNDMVPATLSNGATNVLKWLKAAEHAEQDGTNWPAAIKRLQGIEESIPPEGRYQHNLF